MAVLVDTVLPFANPREPLEGGRIVRTELERGPEVGLRVRQVHRVQAGEQPTETGEHLRAWEA